MATIVFGAVNGNYDDATKWVGGVAPTAADDVQFTAASANCTIQAATTVFARSVDCTGYLGTLTFAATTSELDVGDASGGALKFVSTMTLTLTGIGLIKFVSTTASTTYSLTTGGKTMPNVTVATGSTTTIQAADAWTCGATATVTHSSGKLDTNGQTCSWGTFTNGGSSSARTLTMGSSAITITGTGIAFEIGTATGMTVTTNTATVTLSGATVTARPLSPSMNGTSFVFTGSGSPVLSATSGATGSTLVNLTRTGTAAKTDTLRLSAPFTVTGALLFTGNSLTDRMLIQSDTVGTARTITVNGSHGAHANVDFMDITIAGTAGNLTGTSIGDALGNSGITFTGAVTRYAVVAGNWSSTATWSTTDGGAGGASVPLPQDSVVLNSNSAVGTYTADMPRLGKDITCTGFTRTLSLGAGVASYSSLTLASGMTFSGAQTWTFRNRAGATLTSATRAFPGAVVMNGPSGTTTMADAFSGTTLTLTNGTWDAATFGVTLSTSYSQTAGTLNMGTATWTMSSTGGVWTVTGGSVNASTSIIDLTSTSATAKTFAGGGKTYATLRYNVDSAATLTITGANTFDTLNVTVPGAAANARTVIFPASTITTVTTGITLVGISGKQLTVNSSTGGTSATIALPSIPSSSLTTAGFETWADIKFTFPALTDSPAFTSSTDLTVTLTASESAVLSELGSILLSLLDALALTETAALSVTATDTDSVGLTDSGALLVVLVPTDSGGFSDSALIGLGVTDLGGFSESQALLGLLVPTDSGALSESGFIGLTVTDLGGLTDSGALLAVLATSDSGAFSELGALLDSLTSSDGATLSEFTLIGIPVTDLATFSSSATAVSLAQLLVKLVGRTH